MNRQPLAIFLLAGLLSMPAMAAEKAAAKAASQPMEIILPAGSPQLASLRIEPVSEIAAPATDALNGKIVFDENYTARISSPVLGRAVKIGAQIGDRVKRGQALLVIDSPDLGTALADVRKADADLQLKRKALQRSKLLLDGGVIARKEYESSEADLGQSEAESQRARARLNNLGGHTAADESYTLRAPVAGIVVDRQVNPGSEIRPDATAPLFTITDPDHLWASIDLPERDLAKVSSGQALSIEVDAYPGETFSGKVLTIGAVLDPTTRRVQVRCSVDGKGKLKPEMYARITPLSSTGGKVIKLPNSALVTEGLYNYVFVETGAGHLSKRRIELDRQEREYATVKQGLASGERVVTTGAILLNSELATGH